MKLSIIVPIYNEETTISEVIRMVLAVNLEGIEKEIIIVDDGSQDKSREIISNLQKQHPEISKAYTSLINLGKGAAIRFGLEFATGDIVLIQDADLELDPNEYPKLLKPILQNQTNIVYGSRFLTKSNKIPIRTRFANYCLTLLTNLLFGSQLTDMATAYKVFRKEVLSHIRLRSARFEFEPEITAKFLLNNYKILEVPIAYRPRTTNDGKKIGWIDGIEYIVTLLKYRFIR